MLTQTRINILRSQLALLQLALATDDLTPPVSAAVAAEEGMKQEARLSHPPGGKSAGGGQRAYQK